MIHFIGFRGDEYTRACLIFGPPDFIHRGWDLRAQREVADGDVLVFAKGEWTDPPRKQSYNDLEECKR